MLSLILKFSNSNLINFQNQEALFLCDTWNILVLFSIIQVQFHYMLPLFLCYMIVGSDLIFAEIHPIFVHDYPLIVLHPQDIYTKWNKGFLRVFLSCYFLPGKNMSLKIRLCVKNDSEKWRN